MIRGMENDRKLPNNELKVTKIRAIPPGKNWPNNTPAAIAITTLVNLSSTYKCNFLGADNKQ